MKGATMPSEVDEREIAAQVLSGAAGTAGAIGAAVGGPVGGTLQGAAAIAELVALLVRELGTEPTRAVLEKLRERIAAGEGAITAEDIAADDEYVDAYLDRLFGPKPVPA